jgi:hypothetical protein
MNETIKQTVKGFGTLTLQHVRRTIEAEMIAAMTANVKMTQAHVGQIELMTAIGAELDERGQLNPLPAYFDVSWEDGIKAENSIRCF